MDVNRNSESDGRKIRVGGKESWGWMRGGHFTQAGGGPPL